FARGHWCHFKAEGAQLGCILELASASALRLQPGEVGSILEGLARARRAQSDRRALGSDQIVEAENVGRHTKALSRDPSAPSFGECYTRDCRVYIDAVGLDAHIEPRGSLSQ